MVRDLRPGLHPTIYDTAVLMVILSDNVASNMLLDRVGGVQPNRRLHEDDGLELVCGRPVPATSQAGLAFQTVELCRLRLPSF